MKQCKLTLCLAYDLFTISMLINLLLISLLLYVEHRHIYPVPFKYKFNYYLL